MNMSCTLAEWPRGALFFSFQQNTAFVLNDKVAFSVGAPRVCILPARRTISCSLPTPRYCLRTSSYKHLFNNGTWLFNILFDFCFMVFLIEPCFNCLFCTPRTWVREEGFINEMMIVITSFLSVLS